MSNKIYRSALGKSVDMGSLLAKNETVRAVGNMGVNARGDEINKKNEQIASRAKQVNDHYRKQIRNQIIDEPIGIHTSTSNDVEEEIKSIDGLDTPLTTDNTVDEPSNSQTLETPVTKPGGLASAIAKAREVEQKKLQTPREESRGKKGVNKI